jgi:methyl-accepting chemotaxis protein
MSLRYKILSGFLILAIMLGTAGGVSIVEFNKISHSVQSLLDDNYKSISAAKNMIEALEREDSGVLILMSGEWEKGRSTLKTADDDFTAAFSVAKNNITVSGEQACISAIDQTYGRFKALWERPIVDTGRQGNLSWYFTQAHPAFLDAKTVVNQLMTLNDRAMYLTASELKARAGRAIMPGIVAIVSALIFAVIFNFFINLYVIRPILKLISAIRDFMKTGEMIRFQVDTRDEIYKLTESIRELLAFVKKDGKIS